MGRKGGRHEAIAGDERRWPWRRLVVIGLVVIVVGTIGVTELLRRTECDLDGRGAGCPPTRWRKATVIAVRETDYCIDEPDNPVGNILCFRGRPYEVPDVQIGDCIEIGAFHPGISFRRASGCAPSTAVAPPPTATRGTNPATGAEAEYFTMQALSRIREAERHLADVDGCQDLYAESCEYSPGPYYSLSYELRRLGDALHELGPTRGTEEAQRVTRLGALTDQIDLTCDPKRVAQPDPSRCNVLNKWFWDEVPQLRADLGRVRDSLG